MEAVTIEVTNVEEAGTIMLSTLQPQVGRAITATLTDPDGIHDQYNPTRLDNAVVYLAVVQGQHPHRRRDRRNCNRRAHQHLHSYCRRHRQHAEG